MEAKVPTDQKDSKQPDAKDAPKALDSLKKDLELVASEGFYCGGPNVVTRAVQPKLLEAAATHLTDLTDEKKGSLGKDRLTELVKAPRAADTKDEKALEDAFNRAELVTDATNHLDIIKGGTNDLLKRLVAEPPAADFEQKWNKLFNDELTGFKAEVGAKRTAIEAKATALIAALAAPTDEEKTAIEKYKTEQLKSLTDLETYFKTELEKQRDMAVFDAMAECKFEDPSAAGLRLGQVRALKPGERTLHDHVNTLALDPELEGKLFQIIRTTPGLLSWNDREWADFETKGILPGVYEAGAPALTREQFQASGGSGSLARMWTDFWHWSQKSKFTVTEEGVKFKTGDLSVFGAVGTFDTMLSVARARNPKKEELDLNIWGNFGFNSVSKLADAVSLRSKKKTPGGLPTMKLTDKSILSLLDEGIIFKNSIEDIARLSLKLRGEEPPDNKGQPQGLKKLSEDDYNTALRDEMQHIKGVSAGRVLEQHSTVSSHDKKSGASAAAASGSSGAESGKAATARRRT